MHQVKFQLKLLKFASDGEDLNTTDLIFKYGDKVLCEPGTGDVCAVVVYFYANKGQNNIEYETISNLNKIFLKDEEKIIVLIYVALPVDKQRD